MRTFNITGFLTILVGTILYWSVLGISQQVLVAVTVVAYAALVVNIITWTKAINSPEMIGKAASLALTCFTVVSATLFSIFFPSQKGPSNDLLWSVLILLIFSLCTLLLTFYMGKNLLSLHVSRFHRFTLVIVASVLLQFFVAVVAISWTNS